MQLKSHFLKTERVTLPGGVGRGKFEFSNLCLLSREENKRKKKNSSPKREGTSISFQTNADDLGNRESWK